MRSWIGMIGLAVACTDPVDAPPTPADTDPAPEPALRVRYETPRVDFWGWPWPSDARVRPDGFVDLSDVPRAEANARGLVEAGQSMVVGYARAPVVYLGLTGPLDPASLPSVAASVEDDSPIWLLDVSEDGCGARVPVEVALAPEDAYVRGPVLAAAVPLGTVLRPATPYALVVRDGLFGLDGAPLGRAFVVADALRGEGPLAPELGALRSCLAPSTSDGVVAAAGFTTHDTLGELRVLTEAVDALDVPAGLFLATQPDDALAGLGLDAALFTVDVPFPVFQQGEPPYLGTGGAIDLASGVPVPARWETVTVRVVVGAPGPGGTVRRLVVKMPGTGASTRSFLADPLAASLLDGGHALVSFMPQFHAGRLAEGSEAVGTYNVANPASGRNTMRQQFAETWWLLRVLREGLRGDVALRGVRLDVVDYYGHSQGTQAGAMLAAVAPDVERFVFNGIAGSLANTVMVRKDIVDFEALATGVAGVDRLSRTHPFVQLLHLLGEPADPLVYVPHLGAGSPSGVDVYVMNGAGDETTDEAGMAAIADAADLVRIAVSGAGVPAFGGGARSSATPVVGTHTSTDGTPRTRAAWHDPSGGHHTARDVAAARALVGPFLASPRGQAGRLGR